MPLANANYRFVCDAVSMIKLNQGMTIEDIGKRLRTDKNSALLRVTDMKNMGLVYNNGSGGELYYLTEKGYGLDNFNKMLPKHHRVDVLRFSTVGTVLKMVADNPGILSKEVMDAIREHEPRISNPLGILEFAELISMVYASRKFSSEGKREKACFVTMTGREFPIL